MNVQIGATDATGLDLDQDIVLTELWEWDLDYIGRSDQQFDAFRGGGMSRRRTCQGMRGFLLLSSFLMNDAGAQKEAEYPK